MDQEEDFKLSHTIHIPRNTFAIFIHSPAENDIRVDVADLITDEMLETEEADVMYAVAEKIGKAIDEVMHEFIVEDPSINLDSEFTENVIPFPSLNRLN